MAALAAVPLAGLGRCLTWRLRTDITACAGGKHELEITWTCSMFNIGDSKIVLELPTSRASKQNQCTRNCEPFDGSYDKFTLPSAARLVTVARRRQGVDPSVGLEARSRPRCTFPANSSNRRTQKCVQMYLKFRKLSPENLPNFKIGNSNMARRG